MSIQNNNDMLVNEVMMPLERCPVIRERVILKEALEVMGQSRLGIACIVGEYNLLLGIVTDGDIRRKLLKVQKPVSALFVDDALVHSIRTPTIIKPDVSLKEAIVLMGLKQVWDLPVVDDTNNLVGLLHLHPAIEALLGLNK